MKLKIFRIVFAALVLTSFVVSCDQSKEEAFVEEKPKPKLIDFGFARNCDENDPLVGASGSMLILKEKHKEKKENERE